jgi:hypothetical protein
LVVPDILCGVRWRLRRVRVSWQAEWAVLTLPAFAIFLLGCELRSGIVLDSWWRASYAKGTWQYRAGIAGHVIAVLFFVGVSYLICSLPASSA